MEVMIFGEVPGFDTVLESLKALEDDINKD